MKIMKLNFIFVIIFLFETPLNIVYKYKYKLFVFVTHSIEKCSFCFVGHLNLKYIFPLSNSIVHSNP